MNRRSLKNLYIVTMTLALFRYFWGEPILWWWSYIHCVLWIALGIWAFNGQKLSVDLRRCINTIGYAFVTPYFILWIFTAVAWGISYLSGTLKIGMVTRAVSLTLQFLLILGSVMSTACFFRERLLSYTFTAVCINYSLVILQAIMKYGISDFINTGLLPFSKAASTWSQYGNASNALEVHDVTFALGFFIIYYLQTPKKRLKDILLCILFIYLGYKRIQIAAIAVILIFGLLVKERSRNVSFWSLLYSAVILAVMYLFVWSVKDGALETLASRFRIDFMGRLTIYGYLARFFDFTPLYFGKGMAYAQKIGQEAVEAGLFDSYGHSDILQNYINFGFWGFGIWIAFSTYGVANRINLFFGPKNARIWILFTTYAFITYLTDNTFSYFAFQSVYMISFFDSICKSRLQKENGYSFSQEQAELLHGD